MDIRKREEYPLDDKNISDNWFDEENRFKPAINKQLDINIGILRKLFKGAGDIVQKEFILRRIQGNVKIYVVYVDGLVDRTVIEDGIIKPLLYEWRLTDGRDLMESILHRETHTVDIAKEPSFNKAIQGILKGDTVIFIQGYDQALVVSTKKYPLRGISENDTEGGLRGPRDSFNESFRFSTALIRRRIRDPKLKCEQGAIGQRSQTDYGIMYIEDLADPALVENIKEKLKAYDIDGIFDSGMAEHLMEENWYSVFPMFQATTRPDKVASGILEGRVAVVFDNSPEVILAPCNFNMLLQASDDYYNRWAVGSFARLIRYLAAFISITLPGLYIAVTMYHSEMLPTKLLYAIASARSMVTFPIVVEMLIMEFLFELLREAGIRLPGPLGNTIGIVGGLIVGQSAVEAGIVSTIVVIVVALSAIASFAIPNEEFVSVYRLNKFFIIIASAFLGLYGFILALVVLAIHLSELKSFGVPYMMPAVAGDEDRSWVKGDFIFRRPIKQMGKRPYWANNKNRERLKERKQ
ncbi:MAG: spore germination protein [Lachnospiraceae bacterium]|nr:spore germination protein [Lachnospiraceae bacterium]MBQ9935438.1 spore germination protein [Lachnospiraceae bacterium]